MFYGQYVRKCYTDLDGDGLTEKIVVETNGMACFSDYVIYELNEDKSGVIKWDIKSAEDEYGNIIIPDWIDPYGYELVSDLKFAYDEKQVYIITLLVTGIMSRARKLKLLFYFR